MGFMKIEGHTCTGCGVHFRGKGGSRRKYCPACQAYRDIAHMSDDYVRACDFCSKPFYPYRTNHRICYACSDLLKAGKPDSYPTACNGCGQHNRPAPGLDKTCCTCVQQSAEARARYALRLQEIIQSRINPTTTEAAA